MSYEHQISVLTKLASYQRQSLARGLVLREEMHAAIGRGEEPDTYRVHFLKGSVLKIFQLLEEIAVDFNEKYPGDRYSQSDLSDTLISALSTLQAHDKD